MNNISYISEVDRKRLVVLNDNLRSCETVEEQRVIREEIAELEATRKPLGECDVDECAELRTVIWDKFDRLNRTGKYNIAQQFKFMLAAIERHQNLLHRQHAAEAVQQQALALKSKAEQAALVKETKKKNADKPAQSITSRWTTGIGNLD